MVRAILAGRKTQTRRIIKPQPIAVKNVDTGPIPMCHPPFQSFAMRCPYGKPDDQLWVRETWQALRDEGVGYTLCPPQPGCEIRYRATEEEEWCPPLLWRPSIFMPRFASRITLEVTDIRVERLQDISPDDCDAEGIERSACHTRDGAGCNARINDYKTLWTSINGPESWDENPYVWVVGFKMLIPI
jgi:hypothetical protein